MINRKKPVSAAPNDGHAHPDDDQPVAASASWGDVPAYLQDCLQRSFL